MTTITATKPHPTKEGQGFAKFEDGTEAWTPELPKVLPLIGKELPADWTLRDGPHGKQLLPPKEGPKTAFRNTKEGFLAEAEGRLRWQQVEEERRDRRTALMQAVAMLGGAQLIQGSVLSRADDFYTWLRQTSGASSSASASLPVSSAGGAPEPTSVGGATQAPDTAPSPKVPGGTSAPTDTYVPPSGPVQGEGAANPPGGTTGEGGQAPSPTTDDSLPATADDLAEAAKHGLTPTKTKALAASLGITVTKATELTREQLAAVINRYLEVKK